LSRLSRFLFLRSPCLSSPLRSRRCTGGVLEAAVSGSFLELSPRSGKELKEGGKEEKEGGTGIEDTHRNHQNGPGRVLKSIQRYSLHNLCQVAVI